MDGSLKDAHQDVLDAFADFYGQLYTRKVGQGFVLGPVENQESLPAVSIEELEEQLEKMAKKKSSDAAGLVVEMLQQGS
eukprot:5119362-Karenia_brevis.AAC.1